MAAPPVPDRGAGRLGSLRNRPRNGSGPGRRRESRFVSGVAGHPPAPPYPILYESLIRRALEEDLGRAGDLTSDAALPTHLKGEGRIVARAAGRLAGLPMALAAFRILDPEIEIETHVTDGEDVEAGAVLAIVRR